MAELSVMPQGFPKSRAVPLAGPHQALLCHAGQAMGTLGAWLLPSHQDPLNPGEELLGTPFPSSRPAPTLTFLGEQ